MSNVFSLFQEKKIEGPMDPARRVTIAVGEIMASNAQLVRAVKELSKHLDAVDHVIEALGETDAKESLMHLSKINRESLVQAVRELSQQHIKLPALRKDFINELVS
jgi:hypothetical protein